MNNSATNHNVTNNDSNLCRNELDREIDQFIPFVKDILEGEGAEKLNRFQIGALIKFRSCQGHVVTDRAKLWNESTSQERRVLRSKNGYGGFNDDGRFSNTKPLQSVILIHLAFRARLHFQRSRFTPATRELLTNCKSSFSTDILHSRCYLARVRCEVVNE